MSGHLAAVALVGGLAVTTAVTPFVSRLPQLEAVRAEQARRSLYRFVEQAWPLIEPETPFASNWHLKVMCERLEQVSRGDIKRLIINVPPGTSKSIVTSVMWPAWEWASNPGLRYLTASYTEELTIRDNLRVRDIVTSSWFQRYFRRVELRSDQNRKTKMDTTAAGWRLATSIGGRGTGEHPDRIIIDDPHNPKQALSDVQRQEALTWFDRTISSRGVSRGVRIVLIMQRLHEMDLTGHLLQKGGWRHVMLPMRYDPEHATVDDPRTEKGELLWPALFPEAAVRQLELDLGPYGAAGQLQQQPAPEGGGLFKREHFKILSPAEAEPLLRQGIWCRAWDGAATEGDGDYTVGVLMGLLGDGRIIVAHVVRDQVGPAAADALLKATAQLDGPRVRIREEMEGGSAGKKVIAAHQRLLIGYDYAGRSSSENKVWRARNFRAQVEAGHVYIVNGTWTNEYLDELSIFPNGKHDDQVDASSLAFNELALGRGEVRQVDVVGA